MENPLESVRSQTPWAILLDLQNYPVGSPERKECLEYLFNLYREPIRLNIQHHLLKRRGEVDDDADDLTQGFLMHLLESDFFAKADREKGRFRDFLKVSLRHYVNGERRKLERRSPTGILTRLGHSAVDCTDGRTDAYALAASRPDSPDGEEEFDRDFARALLQRAFDVFKQECGERRLGHYVDVFVRHAWRPGDFNHPTYQETAAALDCTEKDVANHLHRAKKLFRRVLLDTAGQVAADQATAEEELALLRRYFTDPGGDGA